MIIEANTVAKVANVMV